MSTKEHVPHPMIYAYRDFSPQYDGLLRVGDAVDVEALVAGQYPAPPPDGTPPYEIVLREPALCPDGSAFTAHEVHEALAAKAARDAGEAWFRCSAQDVYDAIQAVRTHALAPLAEAPPLAEAAPLADATSKPKSASKSKSASKAKSTPKAQTEAAPLAEAPPKVEASSKAKAATKAKSTPKPKSATKAKAAPKTKAAAAPQAEAAPQAAAAPPAEKPAPILRPVKTPFLHTPQAVSSLAPVSEAEAVDLKKVKVGATLGHKVFGRGEVVAITDSVVTLSFGAEEKQFPFPDALQKGFLKIV